MAEIAIPTPRVILAEAIREALPFDRLLPALDEAFASGGNAPLRHHHAIGGGDGREAMLLLMPAWQQGRYLGVKVATVHPDNGGRGLPAVFATFLLCEAATGLPLACIEGSELTARRTAAVSALGASYLARTDASRLLVVGAGRVASLLPAAFAAVRPIERVAVWNRRKEGAVVVADALRQQGFDAHPVSSLAEAAAEADIVSCATLATEPLISGAWLRPGTHIDLVGSFTPAMRETDDDCIARARLFVDTEAAVTESGDLAGPIARGVRTAEAIEGSLGDLAAGRARGRRSDRDLTLFKAVGTALADLAAAALVYGSTAPEGD